MNAWGRQGLALSASAALALTCGAWCAAQTTPSGAPSTTAPETTSGTQTTPTPQTTAAGSTSTTQSAPRTLKMVQAQAELDKTIDAKRAKQGDPVMAKLVAEVQVPDAQPLPKNTVLEGHVDQVTASDHKSDSTMVVTFDKAKLRDGQEVPIKATILAMRAPVMAADAGGGMPSGGAMPAGGGGGGSMPSGGSSRGASGGSSSASPGPAPAQAPSAEDTDGGAPQQQANGVPDVTLTSNIHQHISATLTSKGKNVHVPDGTQMELAIGVIPAGVQVQ